MEDRIFIEFEEEKNKLIKTITDKLKHELDEEEINIVISSIMVMVNKMIQLMREGKSAHEKFFSDIILNSIDAIIGLDNEFKIFLWNKGAEKMFGYDKKDVIGRDFAMLIPEYKLSDGEKDYLIDAVKDHGFLENFESDRITKSGDIIHVSISRFVVYNEQNEPIGSVGIVRNLTRVKKLEKELREKENLALIGGVVSSIAHSLSNPLNIISGNADYLLLDKKEGDEGYDELKTIIEEASRITKSIRHLLNFSRPIKINKQLYSINKLISDIVSNLKYLTGDRKINIKKNFQKDIPDFAFDKEQLHEAISNMLTNSIQAISKEGEIKVKTQLEGEKVQIEISDTGHGISKENSERIFLPFFSSKEYGKGTGLGLSIARRNIRSHGGDLELRSASDKGTTFLLTLPLK